MSPTAVARSADESPTDRINVLDERGATIGWIDPRTGQRRLLEPGRAADFDETIDFWLNAAGLSADVADDVHVEPVAEMRVVETRFPDPEVVRSLLVPLTRLT